MADSSDKWALGFESPAQLFSLIAVILTAVIFGLFHFVNLFQGKAFDQTLYQAIHAGGMGFLYASLRLRLGAIWPLMILHGFWDFALFVLQDTNKQQEAGEMSLMVGLSIGLPALIYGIFVYWRWTKTQDILTQRRTHVI